MPSRALAAGLVLSVLFFHPATANPPRVVQASPDNGAIDVDPATRELRITFDQPMSNGGMSVVGGGDQFPEFQGKPRWTDGGKTFVYRFKLRPDHVYWLSINSTRFTNFRSRGGEPAVPYPISFQTGPRGKPGETSADSAHQHAVELAREAIDNYYSYRDRLGIDWGEVFEKAGPSLARSKSAADFAKRLGLVLAKAEDKHIWLTADGETYSSYVRPMVANANFKLLPKLVPNWKMHGRRVATGRWDDGIAYLAFGNWTAEDVGPHLLPALEEVADSKALIIDVRGNGGGSEPLAQQVAGCFTDERLLYGKHVYREQGSATGFGEVRERWLDPNTQAPRIEAKVIVLTGPVVMSSCESFLLMMKTAGATLVGAPSQGSSGNPKPHDLENGVTLFLPSWKDMTVDGQELEGVGIAPDVEVKATSRELERSDPVLEAALKLLRRSD